MTGYVALLRAVNVGGTGKLPMTALAQMCEAVGFEKVKTYIASGNVIFRSAESESRVRSMLEEQLHAYAGKTVGVIVRTAAEMADVFDRNPFPDSPGDRVTTLFVDAALPGDPLDGVTGMKNEQVRLGKREYLSSIPMGWETLAFAYPARVRGQRGT